MSNVDTKNDLKLNALATLGSVNLNSLLSLSSSLRSLSQSYFQQVY